MKYTTVTSLTHTTDPDRITMMVKFDDIPQPLAFLAYKNDVEAHGVELYNRAIAGDFGPITEYVEPLAP